FMKTPVCKAESGNIDTPACEEETDIADTRACEVESEMKDGAACEAESEVKDGAACGADSEMKDTLTAKTESGMRQPGEQVSEESIEKKTGRLLKEAAGKSYEEMTVEELQAAILAKLASNGPVTDQMKRDVAENIWHDSLVNWVKSFR
ncbi:MAG: alpha-amylase, partial [Bilifractor sp.]|nr:alpha-amylase [Bilifractor sp.]